VTKSSPQRETRLPTLLMLGGNSVDQWYLTSYAIY